MRFRTRLLVCGYEPEQSLGEPHYAEERWWIHAATFSAQGPYSLPWWPVPQDTVKGDLFILRLAAFEVPPGLRDELSNRRIELGQGVAGTLAEEAITYSGFPLFGAEPGEKELTLPDHPEFSSDREILGDGLVGLAVAHSAASSMPGLPGLYEAKVGTFVPFPDVIGAQEAAARLGAPFDDLETPMRLRKEDQIEVTSEQYETLIRLVLSRFPDEQLEGATLRLKEVAARLGQPVSYYPIGLGPTPRYSFKAEASTDESERSFASNELWGPPASTSSLDSRPEADSAGEGPAGVLVGKAAVEAVREISEELVDQIIEWAEGTRSAGEVPLKLEQIVVADGLERRHLELPRAEAPLDSPGARMTDLLGSITELSPLPGVALMVSGGTVYVLTFFCASEDSPPTLSGYLSEVPKPGSMFAPLEKFNPAEVANSLKADDAEGPYGDQAFETAEHAVRDLLAKLQVWAESQRSDGDLPPETILYDGGALWKHRIVPPTRIKRPSLEDRLRELLPILIDLAPSPSVAAFIHRKKLYLFVGACPEPGNISLNVLRLEIPPSGERFGRPEDVDTSKFSLSD